MKSILNYVSNHWATPIIGVVLFMLSGLKIIEWFPFLGFAFVYVCVSFLVVFMVVSLFNP